jgi:putative oxidoreductase
MNTNIQNSAALVGRILLAVIFIMSGFGKITGFEGTAGYIASKGFPMAQLVTVLTIAIELGGGILLAIGYKARWAGLVLAVFTLLAALIFHNFWAVADAAEKMNQQIHFLKNLAITGGMLMVYAFGPGRYSVEKS